VSSARYVAVSDTSVYVTSDVASGAIYEIPKSGVPDGGAPRRLGSTIAHANRIVFSAGYVYVDEGSSDDAKVWRCAVDAGTCDAVVHGRNQPDGIATDGTSFYFAETGLGDLESCTLDCPSQSPTSLASFLYSPNGVAVSGTLLIVTDKGTGPDYSDGRIIACPIGGCQNFATLLSISEHGPMFVAAQDGVAYWGGAGTTQKNTAQIKSCPIESCTSPTILADNQPTVGDLTVDAKNVYWSSYGNNPTNGIYACSLSGCGGTPKLVAKDADPRGIAVDATAIYWANSQGNIVRRVAK
jgi:hypothetical protein